MSWDEEEERFERAVYSGRPIWSGYYDDEEQQCTWRPTGEIKRGAFSWRGLFGYVWSKMKEPTPDDGPGGGGGVRG